MNLILIDSRWTQRFINRLLLRILIIKNLLLVKKYILSFYLRFKLSSKNILIIKFY